MPRIPNDPSKKDTSSDSFDWVSYAALGKNSTLQGIGTICQCIHIVVVTALLFTDFMTR